MSQVLMIDDDTELCDLVQEYLRRDGLNTIAANNGEDGLRIAQTGNCAMVVLDVMLPGIGGFEVLRRLRATSRIPVLMLTARGDEVDRVLGLELGADDYLPKPFSSRELAARIRAILRRVQPESSEQGSAEIQRGVEGRPPRKLLAVGDVEICLATRESRAGGVPVELTAVEFNLLELLLRAAGDVVTREGIAREVLGRQLLPYDRSVDTHISNVRRKLGPAPNGADRIKTVRGVGYIYTLHGGGPGEELETASAQ